MAKQFFEDNKIEYEEINVENDPEAATEMIDKSGQMGVPVIDIDGKIIVGFNEKAIRDALNLK
jgi:glutaredoxin